MHHVAILNTRLKLLPKILSGRKTIESRWYKVRTAPWKRISAGDTVYFKDSGEPVTVCARVTKILYYEHFTRAQLGTVLSAYGGEGALCLGSTMKEKMRWAEGKKHIILIFLKDARAVAPFHINKTGFGSACAWLTVPNIKQIRI